MVISCSNSSNTLKSKDVIQLMLSCFLNFSLFGGSAKEIFQHTSHKKTTRWHASCISWLVGSNQQSLRRSQGRSISIAKDRKDMWCRCFPYWHEVVKQKNIPPPKLTCNLKLMVSNRNLLFQGFIFRFHVSFRGCMLYSDHNVVFTGLCISDHLKIT